MNRTLARKIIFPAHEMLRGRKTMAYLKELTEIQTWPAEKIKQLQWQKLLRLLKYAYKHVPYYRRLFKNMDAHPDDIRSQEDFSRLPILTKDIIRDQLRELVDPGYEGKLLVNRTGGSTGRPLTFFSAKTKEAIQNAAKMRSRTWWGIKPGDKEVHLWGSPAESVERSTLRSLKDRLINVVVLSAYDMSDSKMKEYANFLSKYRPDLIYGYATALFLLARFIYEGYGNNINFSPKLVVSTAEVLQDYKRKMIEKAFACPVANEYGAHDGAAVIAHECPEGRMHIVSDQVYLEIVNGSKHVPLGEPGDILVTNLESYGMPFIRYKIGDMGTLTDEKCRCGIGFPVMKMVAGRVNDFIVLRNGKRIHGAFLNSIMMKQAGLDRFKVIQHSLDGLDIMVSLRKDTGSFDQEQVKRQICHELGTENITLNFKYVANIPAEPSGKFLYFVSRLEAYVRRTTINMP